MLYSQCRRIELCTQTQCDIVKLDLNFRSRFGLSAFIALDSCISHRAKMYVRFFIYLLHQPRRRDTQKRRHDKNNNSNDSSLFLHAFRVRTCELPLNSFPHLFAVLLLVILSICATFIFYYYFILFIYLFSFSSCVLPNAAVVVVVVDVQKHPIKKRTHTHTKYKWAVKNTLAYKTKRWKKKLHHFFFLAQIHRLSSELCFMP